MINFPNKLSEFVYKRTYSRWLPERARREEYSESIERLVEYYERVLSEHGVTDPAMLESLKSAVSSFSVMPSMRLLWSAGKGAESNHLATYNCSYLAVNSPSAFAQNCYALMHGTGVGFSVERHCVEQLPKIKHQDGSTNKILFDDSKEGWSLGILEVMLSLFDGQKPIWDLSQIRPAGSILQTSGGRASGPGPLESTLEFITKKMMDRQGRQLSSVDCLDIMNKVAECIVVGGTRRSAQISLSDLHDEEMRNAKAGAFWETNLHRAMSNNSAVYQSKPTSTEFLKEWLALAESGTGERGIFNREGATLGVPERRDSNWEFGCNPCAEIILRHQELCNLTSVVLRPTDSVSDVDEKMRLATVMGTIQSSLDKFGAMEQICSLNNRLSLGGDPWQKNCQDERLLGVSLTGQMDCPELMTPENLQRWKQVCIDTNKKLSSKMGINQSKAITCTKPEGTASILNDSSSGYHCRWSDYYMRRVRISAHDPLCKLLKQEGMKLKPETGQREEDANTFVAEFAIKSPDNAINRHDMTALEQLERWLMVKSNFAEHTVSATVYVGSDEWVKVGNWIYENFDEISGISFLPKSDHIYPLAPLEEITKETYEETIKNIPEIDYSKLAELELSDYGMGNFEYSCVGDKCEVV